METIKNFLNPGKATDDEIMYGSGRSNDPVHSGNSGALTGEGSHFDNSRDTPSGIGLGSSNIGNAPTTAGPHSTDLANKVDPRVDSDLDGPRTAGNTTGAYGSTGRSTMPGAFESDSNPYSSHELDPRLGGPTTASGVGSSTTGTGHDTTGQQTGYASQLTTGTSDSHLGRDAAAVGTAGVVGEGIHHHRENERKNLGSSTNAPGTYGDSTTTGPHSSSLLNKLDPRVDSSSSRTMDNTGSGSHYGRDAAALGGAAAVGEGIRHHRENERDNLGSSSNAPGTYGDNTVIGNTGSTTTPGPHNSSLLNKLDPRVDSSSSRAMENTSSGHHYGRDAAAVGGAAAVAEGVHHHRENERDNLGSSGYSGTTPSGAGSAYYGGPAGTAVSDVSGPHATSTANRLDPAINRSGRPIEDAHEHDPLTGGGGETADAAHGGRKHHFGRDAAIGAGGVGLAEHEHRKHEREREAGMGSSTGKWSNTGSYGDNSTYDNTTGTTTGPHKSSLLNKLDPRVDSTSGTTDTTGSGHHYGRDAAVGAGGLGLAEHEHRKHERKHEAGIGNTTGIGSNTRSYGADPAYSGTTGSTSHHYGRDAAVGAGGLGLAEHEHRKHERETGVGSATVVGSSTGAYGDNSTYDNTTGTTTGPHESSLLNKLDPRVDSTSGTMENTGSTGHHYGRDAAIGAGGVGIAEHEHRKHEREREAGAGSTGIGSSTGAYGDDPSYAGATGTTDTTGHHFGRDAAIGAAGVGGVGAAEHEHRKHEREREAGVGNTGTGSNTGAHGKDPSYTDTTGTSDHHYGRDAAVGAAGVGGVGLAEHEHRKHERERESGLGGGAGTTAASDYSTGPAPNTAGPHSKDWMNRLDPRVNSNPDTSDTGLSGTRGTTHGGRDAAAGAGLVGAAGYEAEKHHHTKTEPGVGGTYDASLTSLHHTGRDASAIGAATALDENEKSRLRTARGERDSNYNQGPVEPGYGSTAIGATHEPKIDHHLGRDVVGAGVVGGAAYEAEKHHKHDKDLTAEEKEQKRELKHEEKEARREHKEEKKHHGLLSFLHRDKNKKYTKEEEDEFDRQERDSHSHAGRDAAIGGAAVGGAAYEAEKHHGHHHTSSGEPDTMKPLPIAPGNHGIGTGEGTQNALMMDRRRGEGYDMDPATGTGNTLGAGSDAYQPQGTTLGDRLHGVERNRGVNDGMTGAGYDATSGTTGTHNLGRDAAVGAGGVGLAEHEHRKHEEERLGGNYPSATGTTGTTSGMGYGTHDPVTNMPGSNTEAERSAGYAAPAATKHNVLHKDPPPNHPAARAMAGDGTYPQDLTGTGNY